MRKIIRTSAFKRDVKRVQKQGQKMVLLVQMFDVLMAGDSVPSQYADHALKGKWKGCRELHITPDWLLIYHVADNVVFLDRTGSHAELFGW